MKRMKNIFNALMGISFMIWFFSSLIVPFNNLYKLPTIFNYFNAANTLIVVGFITFKILPKAIKSSANALDFKIGSTKNSSGCTSCKNKKKN